MFITIPLAMKVRLSHGIVYSEISLDCHRSTKSTQVVIGS